METFDSRVQDGRRAPHRGATSISWQRIPTFIWAASAVLTIAAAYSLVATEGAHLGTEPSTTSQRWIELVVATASITAAVAILRKDRANLVGWSFVFIGLLAPLTVVAVVHAAGCGPAESCNIAFLVIADALWFPSTTIGIGGLFLLFPGGRIPRGWRRWLWFALLVMGGSGTVATLFTREVYYRRDLVNPWSQTTLGDLLSWSTGVSSLVVLVAVICIVDFGLRARRAEGIEKLQNRWLVFAGMTTLSGAALSLLGGAIGIDLGWTWALGTALIPVAVAFAITRYQLYEIDRIVSRTVSYTVVVTLLGGTFFVGAVWLPSVLLERRPPVLVAATTLAVAALFAPLRRRVQLRVDHRFNRSRYDNEQVVASFAGTLRDRTDPESLIDGWMATIDATMQPAAASIWIKEPT